MKFGLIFLLSIKLIYGYHYDELDHKDELEKLVKIHGCNRTILWAMIIQNDVFKYKFDSLNYALSLCPKPPILKNSKIEIVDRNYTTTQERNYTISNFTQERNYTTTQERNYTISNFTQERNYTTTQESNYTLDLNYTFTQRRSYIILYALIAIIIFACTLLIIIIILNIIKIRYQNNGYKNGIC